jgi:hypothetical protein
VCSCRASRDVWLLGSWLRSAKDRDYPAWAGDLDLVNEGLDQRLALAVTASCDDVGDVVGDLSQGGGWRRGRGCGGLAGELFSAGAQLC